MDDKITNVAFEIDEFIAMMIVKHELDPLIFGSICLARLTLSNDYTGFGEDFRKLMKNVPESDLKAIEAIH